MKYSSVKAKELLNSFFGYKDFRKGQEEIIKSVTEGTDTVVVMPTGGGKSLCYQIPALLMDGTAIIISPLIALMHDQVENLLKARIPATYINSTLPYPEIKQRLQNAQFGAYKLIYIAPERLESISFLEQLKTLHLSLFAIDEAHCISDWGHDFRPSYLSIPKCFDVIERVPIIALTATATPDVRLDIQKRLSLHSPRIFVQGFNRPNLSYHTEETSKKVERIVDIVQQTKEGGTIVYCGSRKRVDTFTEQIREYKIHSLSYHGGMEDKHRMYSQNEFINGNCKVLVATNAFGMGIDKSDVRNVIHCDLTQTLEAYYQEAGRAGRDGRESNCTLLYHPTDRRLMDYFIEGTYPDRTKIEVVYNTLYDIHATPIGVKPHIPILMDVYQLSQKAGVTVNIVQSVITLLQRYQIIKEGSDSGLASVQFTTSNERVKEYLNNIPQDKQKVLIALLRSVGADALISQVQFDLHGLLTKHDVSPQEFESAMRTFEYGRILRYHPPGSAGGITILMERMPFQRVPIDFTSFYDRKQKAIRKLDVVERYATTGDCKRNFILHYFQDKAEYGKCGKCSSCTRKGGKKTDVLSKESETLRQLILSACSEIAGRFGKNALIDILLGKKTAKVELLSLHSMQTFGIASAYSEEEVSIAVNQAINDRVLLITPDQFPTIELSALGFKCINTVYPPFQFPKRTETKSSKLLESIIKLQNELAHIEGTTPENIISDGEIRLLLQYLPVNKSTLSEIKGLRREFCSRYGSHFIHTIANFLVTTDDVVSEENIKIQPTVKETTKMILSGMSLWEIAQKREIEVTTIAKHIENAIEAGVQIPKEHLISKILYQKTQQFVSNNRRCSLRELREHCGAAYHMAELRVALAFARNELNIKFPKK